MVAREDTSSSIGQGALEGEIERAINRVILRKETQNEQFACEHDLQKIWAENRRLERLLGSHLSPKELESVSCNLVKTLSTLIWIGWHRWSEIGRIFLDHYDSEGNHDRLDDNLPIEHIDQLADSSFFADSASARNFLHQQYTFLPISIVEDEDQLCSEARRLPFIGVSGEVRQGSYGQVCKEVVASRQFIHKGTNMQLYPNQEEVTIARKCLPIEDEFKDEVRNLDLLRSSLSRHTRIMTHLGTLIHGNKFNIFFPWADLDLREFIYEKRIDRLGMKKSMDLLQEASELADALAFLHHGIEIPGGRRVSCVHMDLKPENIVVKIDPKSPAGVWMITDFGISTIRPSSDNPTVHSAASKRLSALNSVRDVHASLTRTIPKRKPGPFQAPEVQNTTARGVGRKSDIWSLGCILCLVLALGEGPGMVARLDKERSRDGDPDVSTDYFYKEADGISASRTEVKWEVKNSILDWLEKLAERCNPQKHWVRDYVNLLKRMIVIEMDRRPDARKVHADLKQILEKAKTESSLWSKEPLDQSPSPSANPEFRPDIVEQPILRSPALSARPRQQNIRTSSLSYSASVTGTLESSLVKLELPPGRIHRTAISPAGGLVAFLSEKHVFLYATKSLDDRGLWKKKLGRVTHLSEPYGWDVCTGTDTRWRSVSLSGGYLLIRGLLGVCLYELHPQNLRESAEVPIHGCPDLSRLVEAEVSCKGQIIFRFTDHLKIWRRETSRQDGHVYSFPITGSLKAASFSLDGNLLYAWACGSGSNYWYIWDIHLEIPVQVCTGSYDSERFGPPIESLTPLADTAAFIIRENQGRLSIAQKDITFSKPTYFSRLMSGIIMCTYASGYNALILVRSSSNCIGKRSQDRIEMIRLIFNPDNSMCFDTRSEIQQLGKSTYQTRDIDRSDIAVTEDGVAGSLRLLISHPDGVLERLII